MEYLNVSHRSVEERVWLFAIEDFVHKVSETIY